MGPGTNSGRVLEGPLPKNTALTGKAALAGTRGGSGDGEAQAKGEPGGRAVAEARLLEGALEGGLVARPGGRAVAAAERLGLQGKVAKCLASMVGVAGLSSPKSELGASVTD